MPTPPPAPASQFGFDFDETASDGTLAVSVPVQVKAVKAVVKTPPLGGKPPAVLGGAPLPAVGFGYSITSYAQSPTPDSPNISDLTRMADTLAAHPDFKVLRRLVPQLSFPPSSSGLDDVATVVVLDTETTGLNADRDKMVELAMLRVQLDRRTGQPVGALKIYNGLEDPGMPMPDEARAVTGITDEMLQGQRLDDAQVHALLEGVDLVIAHNAGFDRPFVEARFAAFEKLAWACSFADMDWKALGRSSAKLSALGQDLGFFYDAHRAEMDCHALLAVLMAPMTALPTIAATAATAAALTDAVDSAAQSTSAPVRNGLLHLLAAAQSPSFRVQATGSPFESKDALKARGYRWDGTGKVWQTRVGSADALAAECAWLKTAVYGGRSARIEVEERDAFSSYAMRPGKTFLHAL